MNTGFIGTVDGFVLPGYFYCMIKKLPILIILFYYSCAFSQGAAKVIADIDSKLSKEQTNISAVLSDPANMYLHSQTPFREVIKKYARPGRVTMITKSEPGKKIIVKVTITTDGINRLDNAIVYLYHTSDKGWYSDTAAHITSGNGDHGHARLFCYVKTDNKGQFEVETIQAKGYPRSDLPAHIHLEAWRNGKPVDIPGELLFDDDPRLTPERKARSIRDGFLVEKNTGTADRPVYTYKINIGGKG